MKISLFASSVRVENWEKLLDSLKSNTVEYEVVFAGPIEVNDFEELFIKYPEFRYITTKDIKPAQCYEIARRHCRGDLVCWISDDCIFPNEGLDRIYNFWKINEVIWTNSDKFLIAVKNVDPECTNNTLNDQRFFPRNLNTPQQAVIGVMKREYLDKLGGFDRRYAIGKFEVDLGMRLLADGGEIIKFEDIEVSISHTDKNWHLNNDWSGDNMDGEALENSWVIGGYKPLEKPFCGYEGVKLFIHYPLTNREVTLKRADVFEPYSDTNLLETSQGHKGRWS